MTVLEVASTVQDQVLDAIKAGQDALVSAVDTLADTTAPITEKLPAAPFADALVKPVDLIDNYFSFAQKFLASQKDFALRLAESYSSAKPAAKPASRAATKTA
jgi:hypothetical protein